MIKFAYIIFRNLRIVSANLLLSSTFSFAVYAEEAVPKTLELEEVPAVITEKLDALAQEFEQENQLTEVVEVAVPTVDDVLELIRRGSSLSNALDTNQDDVIDAVEVANSKRSLLKLDLNSDGTISSSELGAIEGYESILRIHKLQQTLDRDGDNQLSSLEVLEAETHLKQLDTNADWSLSNEELISPLTTENVSSWAWLLDQDNDPTNDLSQQSADTSDWYLMHQGDSQLGLELGLNSVLLDAAGEVVHQWPHKKPAAIGSRAELLSNGLLLRSSSVSDREPFSTLYKQHGLIELVDWNGNVVWEYQYCDQNNYCLYGPVTSLPNGNILITAYQSSLEFSAGDSSPAVGSNKTAGIYEIKPNYDDGSTELIWSWGEDSVGQPMPDELAGLSFDVELNQIAFTASDHQKVVIIGRGVNQSNAALHSISMSDLQAEDQASEQLQILDAQWLQDISGQADIALLLKHDEGYSIRELSLPINKNGTYVQAVKPVLVKQLEFFAEQSYEFHGLTPLENGGFLLLDETSNSSIVSVNQAGELSSLPNKNNTRITSVKVYQQDYAAFNDKAIAKTAVAVTPPVEEAPGVEEQALIVTQAQKEVSDQDELLTGVWSMLIDTPMGEEASELTLVQQGELIAGDLDGDPLKIEVTDNTIEMTLERASPAGVVTIIYNGIIEEAVISGDYIFDSGPTTGTTRSWTASR